MKNNELEEPHPAVMPDYITAYSPVILAVLAAQLVASSFSLRYWLAMCAIPGISISDQETKPAVRPQERLSRWKGTLMKAASLVMLGVALYYTYRAMGRESPEVDACLSTILFPVAIFVMMDVFTTCLALPPISVHRNLAGDLVNIPSNSSHSKTLSLVLLLFSILIYTSTFIAESHVFIIDTFFASIVVYSRWGRVFNSIIRSAVAFFGCTVAIVTATVLLLFSESVGGWTDAQKSPSYFNPSLGRLPVYTLWLTAIACSSLPVSLTSFCLRFDYGIHLEHSASPSTQPFSVNTVPSPPHMPGIGPGAVVPSRIPSNFSKPYFYTSIVTFAFAVTAALAYLPFSGISLDRLEANIFMMVMAVTAFPLQCIAVILIARLRGEWHILSEYEEDWVRRPISTKSDINLEEGSGGNFWRKVMEISNVPYF
ncbi:hypothetical protein BD410DRAFT_893964 [Rickenella mellea]|uniref:Uncharacterized protein n=1 Tax=Rickenella mellea TaxID=50990 RepID=A0A4Y7QLR2_9AGAM|nr:hypothetical protein BD410DRAFT_893964 [Rickenella mellea]